jgi:uncharacterized protein Smg (DUF494 family)
MQLVLSLLNKELELEQDKVLVLMVLPLFTMVMEVI